MNRPALAGCAFSVAAALAGCNDGAVPNTMPDLGFTINGHPFAQQASAAGEVMTSNSDVPMPAGWIVELYNDDLAGCTQFMSNGHYGTVLQLHFPVMPVGTYAVDIGNTIFLVDGDANAATAMGGTLAVKTADDKHLTGSYDVTFVTHEHLTGSFDALVCK